MISDPHQNQMCPLKRFVIQFCDMDYFLKTIFVLPFKVTVISIYDKSKLPVLYLVIFKFRSFLMKLTALEMNSIHKRLHYSSKLLSVVNTSAFKADDSLKALFLIPIVAMRTALIRLIGWAKGCLSCPSSHIITPATPAY